jgi:hypothetical protein
MAVRVAGHSEVTVTKYLLLLIYILTLQIACIFNSVNRHTYFNAGLT